jgi:hypothetical protein
MSNYIDNIQLLCWSAEDAKRDTRQWAALSGELDPAADSVELGLIEGEENREAIYRFDNIGNAIYLIDILQNTIGGTQVTAGSREISDIV